MLSDVTWQALFLGIVEGITEFLPISSTGHLILLVDLLQFSGPPGRVFEIVIQLGAILAICWIYRAKLFGAVLNAPKDTSARRFISNIVIAFLPAAVIGVFAHGFIKEVLFSPLVVAIMLVVGGLFILLVEKVIKPQPRTQTVDEMDWKLALKIGFCQVLAMIPGTSRSGATIMGGLLMGLERKAATEFSFFLAIPTMFGATVYDAYKNWEHMTVENMEVIAIGFVAAFISALWVVRWLINFLSNHGYTPFAYYRIVIGTIMLVLLLG
ncbi:MAG: undecaprenyl-diphosphate phosphatase [Rickettsiales bacterium]|nr:undecaprenyl-diphosphate phosphatase [Rickettsiales bacterium]